MLSALLVIGAPRTHPTHENHEASFMMIPMQLSSLAGKMPVAAIFDRRQLAD